MIRTQISLEEETYEEAQEEARRRGISFAELCRRALIDALPPPPEGDRPWMGHAGTVDVRDPHASQSVDEVVYGRERP
ncbi:MAG TPA: ribbon-helix-helix protein, CopG family [Thermoanaerobaculia bacterium]|nr:ribbon-helix-helix protein, CopG family [Thermoanaerobaculia bacterium]